MWSFVPNEAGTGTVGVCSRCGRGENAMPLGGCPAPAYAPTFISLFAGVGGFDLGLERAGWRCLAQVEIDKHARKVLDQRWPDVPKHGDVTTYTYGGAEDVDAVVGGFPCQDVSVAGRRAGLAGARSGLFWHALRIVEEVRPRWVVLENVPGLLNSHQGRDFAVVLGALADAGFPHVEWRVLDSQFFGVPQRRRRVFIVGRARVPAALPVLVEPEGRGGNPGAGDASWPPPPAGARRGAASGRGVVNALDTQQGGADDNAAQAGHLVVT